MKKVEEILKRSALSQYQNKFLVDVKDMNWLVEQADLLDKIAKRWIEIETNGTSEEADDFYTFIQDTLSPKQDC
jgi:hypothetical protein